MALELNDLLNLILLWCCGQLLWQRHRGKIKRWLKYTKDRLPRRWLPKSPHDCLSCCEGITLQTARINHGVEPYANRKSSRGRRKSVASQGFACLNPDCDYYGIIDEQIHALVSHGKRGQQHDIQYFKCQACGKAFSSRKGTPLYYLKTSTDTVIMVLWLLAEGVDRSVLIRYTGHPDSTIARWMTRMGQHSQGLHNHYFRGLTLALIQMDELYAKVRNKAKASWLWLAIDPVSKALPALHVGSRKASSAYALVHDLKLRLANGCVPAFTTDGLRTYFYAITAHFGEWYRPQRARTDHWRPDDKLLHGQLIKRKRNRKLTYTQTRMTIGKRSKLFEILQANGFNSTIQTAFIERVNLTIRQGVSLLTRRTWSTARNEDYLLLHVEWWRVYYHFARPHESLQGQTPAMKLGLTDHVWSVDQLLRTPLVPVPAELSHSP